ncbi:class I SAM-dependent methyltransferase [Komarekiella sp. 'clone 1']|uniref:Class I SAM-dependent methyltransferase n=1 Tax=Komarekiella delphini-convector SJRDD-AB1 TaxID=2593771 RepID=A0AA40T1R2_9NOST|nr:methyltransferase domain-containing protein [Komarekiella delphini-convector]MBD6619145.1 class I SAM-dependent methyltransferase [Komarekiella delphini-convector SJRDD-AB1]
MSTSSDTQKQMYEAYASSYKIFLKNWQVNRQKALEMLDKHLKSSLPEQAEVSVLSVGPGPGEFDKQFIHFLQQNMAEGQALKYVVVEPNHIHRQIFEATMQSANFGKVHFEMHPMSIEDFQTNDKFDCIHFTHSIYHMPGQERRLILKSLDMLKDGGVVFITLDTEEAVIFKLITKYAEVVGNEQYWQEGSSQMMESNKLRKIIDDIGLSYKFESYPEYLDVSACFEHNSEEGKVLMDFLFQANLSNASPELNQQLLSLVDEVAIDQNSRKMLYLPAGTFVMPKQ